MEYQQCTWWRRQSTITKLGSLALAGLTLAMAYRQVPEILDWAYDNALLNMCVFIWPLVMLPWLLGLSRKRQLLGLFIGASAGYSLIGQPPAGVLHGVLLPNLVVAPRVLGVMFVGLTLLVILEDQIDRRWAYALLWAAPIIGIALLYVAVTPVNTVLGLEAGEANLGNVALQLGENHELEGSSLAAYTCGDVLLVIGQQEWLWRGPKGQVLIRQGSYDPWQIKVHNDGQRIYIVEQAQGRVECYRYPDGELLWQSEGLGALLGSSFTASHAWALNGPDLEYTWPWPKDPEIVLHRIDLSTGQSVKTTIVPPANRFWKYVGTGPLAHLESNDEQVWVAGWSSPQKPVYEERHDLEYSAADQPFVYRPAQGELGELLVPVPDGLTPHHVMAELSYYLVGDSVIDLMPSAVYRDYTVRARSLLTGLVLWQRPLVWNKMFEPILFPAMGRVFVDTGQGVVCLDETTGREYWSYPHTTQLRWIELLGNDTVLGLADGTIVRMGPDGKPVWRYAAQGLSILEQVDTAAGTLSILDSGIKHGEGASLTIGGKYVTLSLADGAVLPRDESTLDGDNFVVLGEYLWYTKQFTYSPSPYNGDQTIYRLAGQGVTVRDMNMPRQDMLVRPGYLLVAEQVGSKARILILQADD